VVVVVVVVTANGRKPSLPFFSGEVEDLLAIVVVAVVGKWVLWWRGRKEKRRAVFSHQQCLTW